MVRQIRIRIRSCFVAIEPNFHAICLNWLQRTQPLNPVNPVVLIVPNGNDEAGLSNNQNVPPVAPNESNSITARRVSVASCRNLFEVDGQVEETGFDFLDRVPQNNAVDAGTNSVQDRPSSAAIDGAVENDLINT